MMKNNDNLSQLLEARRWFLKKLGTTVGMSVAASLATSAGISSALAYSPQNVSALHNGKVLSKQHLRQLHDVCETVLPRTDTPSAAELDCHGFIDHQLSQCHSIEEQQSVKAVLDKIESRAQQRYAQPFVALTSQDKTDLLVAIEARDGFSETDRAQFKFLKGLIIFGYFTTEIGATQVLTYQAVPGGYKGSIKVTPETKSYGSLNFY